MQGRAEKPAEVKGWTARGLRWEWARSWYLLFFLTYYLYWVPLVYAGLRLGQPKWIVPGLFYALPLGLHFAAALSGIGVEDWTQRLVFAAYVIAAIHTWAERGEYLVRLDEMLEERDETMLLARARAEARATGGESNVREIEPAPEPAAAEPALPAIAQLLAGAEDAAVRTMLDGTRLLDLNAASAPAITQLLGFDAELAAKAIKLREADGPFKSLEDFRYRVGVSIDTMSRIASHVLCAAQAEKKPGAPKPSGRIVDV